MDFSPGWICAFLAVLALFALTVYFIDQDIRRGVSPPTTITDTDRDAAAPLTAEDFGFCGCDALPADTVCKICHSLQANLVWMQAPTMQRVWQERQHLYSAEAATMVADAIHNPGQPMRRFFARQLRPPDAPS